MSDWSYPLCGCFGDCSTCLFGWFCPCLAIAHNAETLGKNKTLCCLGTLGLALFFVPGYVIMRTMLRGQIRESKNINGNVCLDCLTVYFCAGCSLVQETREVKSPGEQAICRE